MGLILASASPRRFDLLSTLGLPFTVVTSGVDEEVEDDSRPGEMVVHLAERKAQSVAGSLIGALVIGADTTVAIDGLVLNKPLDADDARRMLRLLRGRDHEVWTGVVVLDAATGRQEQRAVRSLVRMRAYSDDEIEAYVATGEPLDKAGAYAIQGGAGVFVERIEGCYANVVGLPLCALSELLAGFDLTIETGDPVCRLPTGRPCPRLVP
ncbi:MAG: septum formation inhibitor Maf [Thermomicrobiales bacterium]|nr:septum formation inhibitor Maf [Thermomicrobiales bacterium]